jgi:hypothetical protein
MATKNNGATLTQLDPASFGTAQKNTAKEAKLKYSINQFAYPAKVSSTEDLQHYVGFFINVRGKSKFLNKKSAVQISSVGEQRINTERAGEAFTAGLTAAAVAGGIKVGASLATKVLANVGKTSTITKAVAITATAAAGGGGGYLAASFFEPDTKFRIDTAIMLAVNERPSVKYGVEYSGQEMGSLAGFLAGGTSAVDVGRDDMLGEGTAAALLNVAQIPAGIAGALGATKLDVKAAASLSTGTTPNPFREQIFQNVETRTFNFDYKFLPRNYDEVQNVFRIIKEFKFHMHPELSAKGLFYIYPSEFNIVYYYQATENKYIHKISTCVLENMSVDYGGSQQFGSFADGAPNEINMRLSFRELEILTKERIQKGY